MVEADIASFLPAFLVHLFRFLFLLCLALYEGTSTHPRSVAVADLGPFGFP